MLYFSSTHEALDDLRSIVLYTIEKKWGKSQTVNYVEGLHLQASRLAQTPEIGRPRIKLYKGLLSFPYASHILFYKKSADGITIIRVLHKSMDTPKHL